MKKEYSYQIYEMYQNQKEETEVSSTYETLTDNNTIPALNTFIIEQPNKTTLIMTIIELN